MSERTPGPTIICPSEYRLRDPAFTHAQAKRLVASAITPEAFPGFMAEELHRHFRGQLYKPAERPGGEARRIDLRFVVIENIFGEDPARQIRAYRRFAERPPRKRLQVRQLLLARWIFFALVAFELRTGQSL